MEQPVVFCQCGKGLMSCNCADDGVHRNCCAKHLTIRHRPTLTERAPLLAKRTSAFCTASSDICLHQRLDARQ